jgi:hypothetical protein
MTALTVSALFLGACEETDTAEDEVTEADIATEVEEVDEDVDESADDEEETDVEEVDTTEESGISFDGTTITTNDVTIEITDYKVLAPGEGNNYTEEHLLAFWYDTTVHEDVTDNEYDPMIWIMIMSAVQDNDPNVVNELNVGVLPDEAHLDTQMQTIKPGGTLSSSVSYELTDLETPVELILENIATGEVYGSHTYEIN